MEEIKASLSNPYDPHFWVAVSFVLFIMLAYKKIFGIAATKLDDRTAKIKAELDEAQRLRKNAADLLEVYKQKQADYLKEAQSIISTARQDADALRQHAEKELQVALDARMKQALERIAQEEEKAVSDVRNHVVDIALAAARVMIVDQISTLPQDELLKLALSDIERKIH